MSNNQKNVGNKQPDVDNLRGKHRRDSKAYERKKAKKALEDAKKKEQELNKPIRVVPQGVTGAMLKGNDSSKK